MMQLICNGVEVDVPRGTSIAWKNTNILFGFDKASCERSLTFKLPATPTNDKVFELVRLTASEGAGFRNLYDAEYRDGLLVKRGYAYVTASYKRDGYDITLLVGEMQALKRLKDAGKVGDVLPDAELVVSKTVQDANITEFTDMKVLRYEQSQGQLMPSWSFRPMLVDALNALNVPFTLPAEAENLRITNKELKGSKVTLTFKNERHSEVEFPSHGGEQSDKYNTLSINANSIITVLSDVQLKARSYTLGEMYRDAQDAGLHGINEYTDIVAKMYADADEEEWYYRSDVYRTTKWCKITFPKDFPDDIVIKPLFSSNFYEVDYEQAPTMHNNQYDFYIRHPRQMSADKDGNTIYLSQEALPYVTLNQQPRWALAKSFENQPNQNFDTSTGYADTAWNSACLPNNALAGATVELPPNQMFVFARREDFACNAVPSSYAGIQGWHIIYDCQPRFHSYIFDLDVEAEVVETPTEWRLSKRDNLPEVTALDLLRTLSAVTGKVLYYTDNSGIEYRDLGKAEFQRQDWSSRIISVKKATPKFGDFERSNVVKYANDKMTTERQMIKVSYDSEVAMLTNTKELQTLPFSCVGERAIGGTQYAISHGYAGYNYQRIYVVNVNGDAPDKDIMSSITEGDNYLQRQQLQLNQTIKKLAMHPLQVEVVLSMTNYEYSKVTPFTIIHLNGVDYVWGESSWQKGQATFALNKWSLDVDDVAPLVDYVTNGLVFRIDGILDGGIVPTDLVGGMTFAVQAGTAQRNQANNGWYFDGVTEMRSALSLGVNADVGTIEIVIKDTNSLGRGIWFISGSNGIMCGTDATNHLVTSTASVGVQSYTLTPTNSITTISANALRGYQDGQEMTVFNILRYTGYGTAVIGCRPPAPNYPLTGEILAIRVYNRQLSASEMMQNQAVDRRRFGF